MRKEYVRPVIRIPECDDLVLLAGSPSGVNTYKYMDQSPGEILNNPPKNPYSDDKLFDDINKDAERVTSDGLSDWYI